MLEIGSVLAGRYRIEQLLGRGGSALTWRAFDLAEQSTVALKLLQAPAGAPAQGPQADGFRAEFARLRELSHPHLARVREYGRAPLGGLLVPFFTSDLVVGGTLRAHCARAGWPAAERPLRDALSALAFLHRLGLRHGDLKPENVMVDAAGRGVLIDLGCAVPCGSRLLVGGTPRYLAPELARGEAGDARADLYALGVLLLELGAPDKLAELARRLSRADVRTRPRSLGAACAECGLDWELDAATLGTATPLLGRAPQLRAASAALAEAARAAPGPRVVWVEGARGVGTTRFLRELCFAVDPALALFEGNAQRDALRALLGRAFGPVPAGSEGLVRTIAALAARPKPALIVWHDAQQAGAAQQAELALALGATPAHGSLAWLIGSTQPAPALDAESCLRLSLQPLEDAELQAWAGPLVPASRIAALRAHTGGYPLHVERTLCALASGQLGLEALHAAGPSAAPGARAALAPLLADLDAAERACLAHAALGLPAPTLPSTRLLERGLVCVEARSRAHAQGDDNARERDDPDAHAHAPAHADAPVGEQNEPSVQLARAGDAQLVLDLLPPTLVAELSVRAAAACEREATPEACARRIAHLARAGQPQAARRLFMDNLRAAERAPRRFAVAAAALAEEMAPDELVALAALQRQSGEPRRALALLARARRAAPAGLRLQAAECYLALGNMARAARELTRAREQSDDAAEPAHAECLVRLRVRQGNHAGARALAAAALQAQPRGALLARLHEGLALASSYLGEHVQAEAALDAADAADAELSPRAQARRWALRGFLALRRADPERALSAYERALAAADELGLSDLVANALLNLAGARHMLGSYGHARDLYERALRMARALGRRHSELSLRANLANLALECGAFDEAAKLLDALDAHAGVPAVRGALRRYRAELLLLTGHPEQALALLEQPGAAGLDERDSMELRLLAAEALLGLGAPERAAEALADAVLRAQSAEPDLEARCELTRGRAALESGREELARSCFERALAAARRAALPPLVARSEALLAELYARTGAPSLAREHRARAQARWERMALDLPAAARDAFWSHPQRAEARAAAATERTGRSASSLSRVVELSRRINAQRTVEDVLAFALDAAIELTSAERGFVLLHRGGKFEVKSARHVDNQPLASAPFEWSRGIAERVITSGEPVITLDAAHDARFQAQASVHAMGLKSVLCVPVLGTRGLKGALYLDNRYLRSRFTEADAELVQALAEQVAVALGNAQLLAELEQKQRELLRKQRKVEELLQGKEREVEQLSEALAEQRAALGTRYAYGEIVGASASLRRLFATLDRVIPTDLPVVVLGESGTGKELVARAIHGQGPRAQRPFVGINCGALPEALLESELFGHVKGAFTGADRDKTGLFVAARGGTLFLDELGELPLSLQVKLLRALTERAVRPLGATRSLAVDVRIVAATNRELRRMVAEGTFREDLFYRLGVVEVTLPPLRERRDDILPIAESILEKRALQQGSARKRLSADAAQRLLGYPFPGNVRELENILLRASALCEGPTMRARDLHLPTATASVRERAPRSRADFARQQEQLLLAALERERWNVSAVARTLGVPRNSLYCRLARLGLTRGQDPIAHGGLTSPPASSGSHET